MDNNMPKPFPHYNGHQEATLSIFLLSNILNLTSFISISIHKLFQQIITMSVAYLSITGAFHFLQQGPLFSSHLIRQLVGKNWRASVIAVEYY